MIKKVTAVALSLSLFAGVGTAKASTEHKVKQGDTLSEISNFYGTTIEDLARLNNIKNVNLIYVGDVLSIEGRTTKKQESTAGVAPKGSSVSDSELDILSRIVHAEAKGESFKGKVAVANVVMNRVNSDQFPNDVKSVIYQKGQFSPVSNGAIYERASDESKEAARVALSGTNYAGDSLYFWSVSVPHTDWVWTRSVTTQIGTHVFAK
ncbi:cell wall hydrolase [Bacillus haynesii]|uniref:cell wall hydrolase n=1 Tax=Bacillus haynesii TaxID=1925021 RepID=UPI0022800973|nr:cell wall hydrolase [Bacillus haynesii]MCY9324044.1 cell wall hydrolase [Bacillus haynesii]